MAPGLCALLPQSDKRMLWADHCTLLCRCVGRSPVCDQTVDMQKLAGRCIQAEDAPLGRDHQHLFSTSAVFPSDGLAQEQWYFGDRGLTIEASDIPSHHHRSRAHRRALLDCFNAKYEGKAELMSSPNGQCDNKSSDGGDSIRYRHTKVLQDVCDSCIESGKEDDPSVGDTAYRKSFATTVATDTTIHRLDLIADQSGSNWSVSGRLPQGGNDAVIYNRRRVAQTISFIIGGWSLLIMACFGFKWYALRYSLHAPDQLAEYINAAPTASTQWFTFCGVLLGEIALILWGHSIGYMAFRRLAYGKERTELLTYAAWNEMSRAGYTLSKRKPLWPICTVIIFVGNTFLPAGFSTLLTPKQMVFATPYNGVELDQLSPGFASAIGFLPASTFPNPANLSCGSQFVSNFWTFASHPGTIFDPCPSLDDVQTLIMAGRAKLEASVNQSEPLFKLPGSLTYVGGTGGIATLGPLGILPWGSWTRPPPRAPRPQGYNYTYTLNQQGLTVDVKCWPPKAPQEQAILHTERTDIPHLLKVTLKCSAAAEAELDISYHYIGSSSIILKGCTSKNAKGEDDPDATIFYFKDAGASVYGSQGSELGGDLLCELKPKWTRNLVEYVSHRNWIRVMTVEDGLPPNRLTGYYGELGPGKRSFSPSSESSKRDFFDYYTRLLTVQNPLSAVGNAFVFTGSLSAVINGTDSNGHDYAVSARHLSPPVSGHASSIPTLNRKATDVITLKDLNGTVLFGKDSAIQSLAAFNARVNAQKVRTWIQPSQVEIFIKGVFEYAATSQREWFQHYAVDGGGFNGAMSTANGTAKVKGVWQQQTVGWGTSTGM